MGLEDQLVFLLLQNYSQTKTETYNGTNWTEVNNLNTARSAMGGNGIVTAAICAGGENPGGNNTVTEIWTDHLLDRSK